MVAKPGKSSREAKPRAKAFRIPRARPWYVALSIIQKPKTGSSSSLVLIYGFAITIVIGTVLLMLPIASKTGHPTSLVDALFTSTSAVCVTGLVIVDTGNYWSFFGQSVILALIQIGGFGFMATATLLLLLFGRSIGLRERLLIRESMGLKRLGGLVGLIKQIAIFAILTEAIGAVIFYIRFSTAGTQGMAIWKSIFHSVSAFNNAGFDLFGDFQSLSGYQRDPLTVITTAILIILGGISFLVLSDILKRRNIKRLSLDSKLVLSSTLFLLILGTVVIFITEFSDPGTLGTLSPLQKLLNAFFQSVTARTAGFSTISMGSATTYVLFFTMLLMFIGGASGSTAGGIKVNTFGLLSATIWSTIRGKEKAGAFRNEFIAQQMNRALALVILSLILLFTVVFLLTITEKFNFIQLLFETVSAFGTVGLSTGITPGLSTAGRLIITITMFIGRLGPLALVLALTQRQQAAKYRYPKGVVRIG